MDALPILEQAVTIIPNTTANVLWRLEAIAKPGSLSTDAVWAGRRTIVSGSNIGQVDWAFGSADPKYTQAQIFACTTWS